jgi:hypothetical protein
MSNPSEIRLAIASQPTVEQSVNALIRAIANSINAPVTDTGPDSAHALAAHMADDPKSWSDAVLANTPLASQSAPVALPLPVPASGNPDDIKATVAAQPSVAQGVAALLRHAVHHIRKAADGDDAGAKAFAAGIAADPRGWTDALAKTSPPPASSNLAPVPSHVAPVFATLGSEPAETAPEPAPWEPAPEPKAKGKAARLNPDN